ncbi:MAG: phosphatidylglycerol lysyltransferase domain-containing protein [Smithella sp.]
MKKRETIDFQHRALLLDSFRQMNLPISDYTFANIFLFRSVSRYEFLTTDCGLFIAGCNRQAQRYLMPLIDLRKCDQKTFDILRHKDNFLFPIPEEWLSSFPEDKFVITCDDSESDYIYLTGKMASFKGKQYNRHRNHLNQFLSAYNHQVEIISEKNVSKAMIVLQAWQNDSGLALKETDFEQCREALEKFSLLALRGSIYYIEHKPVGFIVGEPLNNETFVLHFAKAIKKYHGIYEFMFNDTARHLLPRYKFLNLEEDMGNDKLRQTKESYGPEAVLKKYRVSLIH